MTEHRPADRDDDSGMARACVVILAAFIGGGLGAGLYLQYMQPLPTPPPDHAEQLRRMEAMQRQALGAIGSVQANQGVLHQQQGLLLKAQIAAGRLTRQKKVPDSTAVVQRPVKPTVAGSNPAPAATTEEPK